MKARPKWGSPFDKLEVTDSTNKRSSHQRDHHLGIPIPYRVANPSVTPCRSTFAKCCLA